LVDTSFPTTTPIPISPALNGSLPNWQHGFAARAGRAYAVWVAGGTNVYLAYSLDGAKTWTTYPMPISKASTGYVSVADPTVTVDAGDPSVIYIAHNEAAPNTNKTGIVTTVAGIGGANPTISKRVAFVADRYAPTFLDVVSPAANTVVVAGRNPVVYGHYAVAGDAQRGHCWPPADGSAFTPPAGCATESWTGDPTIASCGGTTAATCPTGCTWVSNTCHVEATLEKEARIATVEGGGATPRVCMTWPTETGKHQIVVTCSANGGKTWAPLSGYAATPTGYGPIHPVIALSASGKAAVAYQLGGKVYVMTSQDAGATFGPAVNYTIGNLTLGGEFDLRFTPNNALWIATEEQSTNGVYVDKACDPGPSPVWSGSVRVNATPLSARANRPTMLLTGDEPAFAVQWVATGSIMTAFQLF
jgi:hypothetical protein